MVDVEPAVQFALAQVGKPYNRIGDAGPNAFDCSGLTMRAFQKVGINMPHLTYSQIKFGVGVSKSELQRGDLVFPDPGHVQIYLGGGKIVEAPHPGSVVRVTNMWGFFAARRLGTISNSNGSSGNPISTTPVGLPNPLDLAKPIGDVLDSAQKSAKWLSDSHNWLRVLYVVVGTAMVALMMQKLINVDTALDGVMNAVTEQ